MRLTALCGSVAFVVGFLACGGDGGTGGSGGGGTTTTGGTNACSGVGTSFKAKGDALGCPTDPTADKQQGCEAVASYFPSCADELEAAMKCIFALPDSQWECDPNGMPGAKAGSCPAEIGAVSACTSGGTGGSGGTTTGTTSGTTTGPGCAAVTACGGDVVGTWTYQAACIELGANPIAGVCPSATAESSIDVTGTVEFKSDGSYAATGTQAVTITIHAPKSCFGGACPPNDPPATWIDAGTECVGTMALGAQPNDEAGTYTTNNGVLQTAKTSGSSLGTSSGNYCVVGSTMETLLVDGDGNKVRYTLSK